MYSQALQPFSPKEVMSPRAQDIEGFPNRLDHISEVVTDCSCPCFWEPNQHTATGEARTIPPLPILGQSPHIADTSSVEYASSVMSAATSVTTLATRPIASGGEIPGRMS